MFHFLRFPVLLACLVSVTVVGCSPKIESSSTSPSASKEEVKPAKSLSPEEQEQVEALVTQGNEKLANGNYKGAIADFNDALAIDQNHAKALGDRGVARSRLENYEGALADYNQALAIDDEAYEVYYNRGIVHTNLQNYENAIADYSQAIERKPDFARAIGNRGFAYAELENYTAAIKDLEKAAELFKERGNKKVAYRLRRAARYIQP
jgi:tetratricopeptide (TPR) repeat protein